MRKSKPSISYGPMFAQYGYQHLRWVENASRGLRKVGFADEIVRRMDHRGWYSDSDCYETYRGIVYQLPSRDGDPQYVYGYADPNNDDCAFLCFDATNDKEDAARSADQLAEIFAEHAREYSEASNAGMRYRDLADEISDARKRALAISAEMRAAKRAGVAAPTICATLRADILAIYHSIVKIRKKRAELLSNFGRCEGFSE